MLAKDYNATVQITSSQVTNPTILDWTAISVSNRYGEAETQFSIDLRRPINLEIGDTVTISDGFGSDLIPLVTNKKIEGFSGSMSQTKIHGIGSKLTRRGPVKTIVYVNQTWLKQRCPAYHLHNTGSGPYTTGYSSNIILQYNPGASPVSIDGVSQARLMLAELPGRNTKDKEFGCIVSTGITRQDIATRLASMCGYTLKTNMPRLPIQRTYTIHATQTYWQSIMHLFGDWKPMIFVRGTDIYVMDVGTNGQAKTAGDTIALTEDSFSLYEWNIQKNQTPIDHILITGPDSTYTYVSRNQTMRKRTYSEVSLPGSDITLQFEDTEEDQIADELEKTLLTTGSSNRVVRVVRTIVQRQDPNNPQNSATMSEVTTHYNSNGDKVSEVQAEYKYAAFNKPLKCITTEYGRIGVIGGGTEETFADGVKQELPISYEWTKLSETTMTYRDFYEDIGQVETDLQQFCLCVTYKDTEKHDGTDYDVYDQTQPYWQAIQAGQAVCEETADDGSGWESAWQLYKTETVRFDKSSPVMYRKTRLQTIYYPSRVSKHSYEDIILPSSKHNSRNQRKWEYFWNNGSITYHNTGAYPVSTDPDGFHPRVDISNSDIISEAEARLIASRQFASNSLTSGTATIETTLPLHNIFVGGTLALPACTKEILSYDGDGKITGYENITIPAKVYWIVGHERIIQYSGDVGESQRDIRVADRIELKEYF